MTTSSTRQPSWGARGACARVLGVAWLLVALACEGPEAQSTSHKVQLSAQQAAQLSQRGVALEVLADYGAFQLVRVEATALAALPEEAGVELRDDYDDILLNAGVINTASAHGQSLRGMRPLATGKRFHLVQFVGPIQAEWYQALEATGVQVVTYIPNNAYLVYGEATSLGALQQHIRATPAIQWNGDYLDDYKLHPAIQTRPTEAYSLQLIKDEETNGETLELIRQLQSRDGVIQESLGYINVVAYLSRRDLYQLVTRPDVLSIQPRVTPRKVDERQNMIIAGQITGGGPTGPGYLAWLASKGFTQAQFTASGFGVDVSDSGLDNGTVTPNHFGLYVGGRINAASRVAYSRLEGTANSGSTIQGCDGHGNLNAHIIAGYAHQTGAPYTDAEGFTHGLGVAPFVKVGASVVFDPANFTNPDYEDLQSRAYRDGMRVSSNSWGADLNSYDADAQRYDALVRDAQQTGSSVPNPGNQEMIIVFAAGNSGPGANTVGTPSTAKNLITVGASENVRAFGAPDLCNTPDSEANSLHDVASFSSRGPASDGRKKPDLMAPGTHVAGGVAQTAAQRAEPPAFPNGQALSCFNANGVCGGPNNNFYPVGQQWFTASSGTSHSTPAVAGGAALVRQYFLNQGVPAPSAAMTKAYLMSSARYMTGVGANDSLFSNNQGMGLMDLGAAFDGTPRLLDDQNPASLLTATGQQRAFSGVVADSTRPFRVTVAWTDAPGSTTASAWKNNLDLTVTVGGNTYKGNVFTGPRSVTGGTADSQNNVESVFLPAGTEGAYSVTVTATNINSDGVPNSGGTLDQDFALIVYNTCASATATPTGVSATASGDNRIDVSWVPNGATSYNIYRSITPGGPYTRVTSVAAPPYVDAGISGGTTYYYVVRAVQCSESPASPEVSAVTSGLCTLPPTFAGLTAVNNAGAAICANTLSWSAATAVCGGTLSYSVYRGTTPGFTPSAANQIATGVAGTGFTDNVSLAHGTPYYYVVRATETSNATLQEANTVERSSVPTGAMTPGVRYFDDMDANRPANASSYWIATAQSGSVATINLVTNCRYQSATRAYRFGGTSTSCGGSYPASTQTTLSLGGNGTVAGINGFTLPASTINPQMTFRVWYSMEQGYDGAYLVYSTSSAAGPWTVVSDAVSSTRPYISSGGYDGVLDSNASLRTWTGLNTGSNGALKAVTVNLSALAGQKAWFALRFSTDSTINAEGFYADDVRITADAYATCTTQTPPPGGAVSYQITGLPASAQAGSPLTVTITALNSSGGTATGYDGTAAFTSTDPRAVLPPNTAFTAGVASNVPVTFRTAGVQSLTASDTGAPALLSGSASTTLTAGPAAGLAFTVEPSAAVAGTAITPDVKVGSVDAFGNPVMTGTHSVTLALSNNPGGGTLSGTTTVAAVNGVATFSDLSLDKAGTGYILAASSAGLTSATSSAFRIDPAAAARLAFITQPSNSSVGTAITPAVRVAVQDTFGNTTASTANVTVALGSNPTGGTLSGTTTVAAANGVATFNNLSLDKRGTGYTLSASSGALTGAASTAFDITGFGPPYRVLLTRQPTDAVAGAAIAPSVQASIVDSTGTLVASATTAVSVSLGNNPGGGALGGTTTVNAVGGVATFSDLSVDRAGASYTLVAGASGLFTDTSVGFNVRVGAPAQLAFTSSPSGSVISGEPFTVRVAVRDMSGNLVTGTPTQVTLSLANAAGAILSGTKVATTVNGVATFTGLSVDKAGSGYTLQADATGLPASMSPAFGVTPGAAAALAFTAQPGTSAAGAVIAPAVRVAVLDGQGNTTSSSASISLALGSNTSGGTLSGTRTVAAINGVATFEDLSVDKLGTGYTLRASSGALTRDSASFNVVAGAAARLVFRTAPADATAGAVLGSLSVEIQDRVGNRTASTAQVTLSLGGSTGGTLGGTTTVAAVNGVATFPDLFIHRAATGYTLTARSTGLSDGTSGAFNIAPAAPAALAFTVQPGNGVAGAIIAPAVQVAVRDAYGNLVPNAAHSITLALVNNSAGATLEGTTTVAAINGVATFGDLSVSRAGTGYRMLATEPSLPSATSSAFSTRPGGATRLAFTLGPTHKAAGANLGSISVELQDSYGNLVNSAQSITLSLQGGQGGTLSGTTTVPASGGVATFSTLSIARAAVGYRLMARASGLTEASSAAFDITPGPAAALAFTGQPGATVAASAINPVVRVAIHDAFGNLVTTSRAPVSLSLGNNPGGGTLSGTTTVNATNGVATFPDLALNTAARGYRLVASTGALPAVTSDAFDISAGPLARLLFLATPDQGVAGAPLTEIRVELRDAQGNVLTDSTSHVTLGLGESPAGGQLLGPTTAAAVNGVAVFSGVSLRRSGNGYTLVASAHGITGAASAAFTVTPGPAASYQVTLPPSVTAGQEATLSATAYDAYGNPAATYGGAVNVVSSDTAAVVPTNAAFVEGVLNGLKVTFKGAGLRTLTLTDTANPNLSGVARTNVTPFAQPTVAVTDPQGGTTVSGKVNITATGVVAAGTTVAQIAILVDGVVVASGADATVTGTWDSSGASSESPHTLTAIITDGAGNVAYSAPVTVSVQGSGCGCGATSGTDAGLSLGLLLLGWYALGRRRRAQAAA